MSTPLTSQAERLEGMRQKMAKNMITNFFGEAQTFSHLDFVQMMI
jgi:hypothetical protein